MQYIRLVLITLLSTLFLASVPATAQNLQWFANDHFQLTDAPEEALLVTYHKQPWEAFTLYVGETDFSKNTILNFAVQSADSAILRIDLMDHQGKHATGNAMEVKLKGGAEFVEVQFDFGRLAKKIDLSKISHFHFYVNPGVPATGKLLIKDIKLPEVTIPKNNNAISVFPNPVTDILKIKSPHQLFDKIILLDILGKEITHNQMPETHYHQWTLTDLSSGVYQYQLFYQNKMIASDRLLVD